MKKVVILIFLLLINLIGFTQNKDTINQLDENELKIGYWKLDQIFQGEELSCEGRFVVIPLDQSIDYSKDFDGIVFLHFDKKNYTLEYSGKTNKLISVKDGEWISYRKNPKKNNKIAMINYFNKGYGYKTRTIPALNSHELFSDYTKVEVLTDSSKRWDTYLGNDTIVYESYNEDNKYTYYPNNKLKMYDILLRPNSLYSMPDTVYLKFSARENVIIDSISTRNKNLDFINPSKTNPLRFVLNTNQTDSIGVIYRPKRNEKEDKTTFTLHGSDCNYTVYLWLSAYDINRRNVQTLDSLTFYKNDNPKLNIQRMDNHTYFKIYGWKFKDDFKNQKPILRGYKHDTGSTGSLDLSKLNTGEYILYITSENIDKKVKISIK
tara:strand:- start:217 stop:1350 length:1134 start_codon:yes stop_codon:yes gene_type:complete